MPLQQLSWKQLYCVLVNFIPVIYSPLKEKLHFTVFAPSKDKFLPIKRQVYCKDSCNNIDNG